MRKTSIQEILKNFSYGLAYFYQLGNPGFKGEFSDSPVCVVMPLSLDNVKNRTVTSMTSSFTGVPVFSTSTVSITSLN